MSDQRTSSIVDDFSLFRSLGLIVVGATVVVLLTRKLRTPSIVAYIVAGLLLGPVSGLVEVSHVLEIISEVGIVLLLFLVGLELSLEKIRDVGRVAFIAGIGQVVFTALGGFGLCRLLGFSAMESIFLATSLTFSSTVVVVKLLDHKKELHSLYGRIAVGIFLVQDLVVIVALTFLAGLGQESGVEPLAMVGNLAISFLGMAALLVLSLLSARYFLPSATAWLSRSSEALFLAALTWCFGFVLLAEFLKLSPEIGAFLAGISLAQVPFALPLQRAVHPVMNFFILVFFVTLGIQMEVGAAMDQLMSALVLSLFVLIGNPFIFMILIVWCKFDERTAFMTSVTVAQISEFSFIFGAMGVQTGLIEPAIMSLIAVVGLVTIILSSYMILFNQPLYAFCKGTGLLKLFRASQTPPEDETRVLRGHIVVVGMNGLGRRLVKELNDRGERLVVVDTDRRKLEGLPGEHFLGDVNELIAFEALHIESARLVITALKIEDTNTLLIYRCRKLGVPCAVHAFDKSVVPAIEQLGPDYIIDSKSDGHKLLLETLSVCEVKTP